MYIFYILEYHENARIHLQIFCGIPVDDKLWLIGGVLRCPTAYAARKARCLCEKLPSPNRKGSSSNHHFSGAMLNFGGAAGDDLVNKPLLCSIPYMYTRKLWSICDKKWGFSHSNSQLHYSWLAMIYQGASIWVRLSCRPGRPNKSHGKLGDFWALGLVVPVGQLKNGGSQGSR